MVLLLCYRVKLSGNDDEEVLPTPQISRTGTPSPDAV